MGRAGTTLPVCPVTLADWFMDGVPWPCRAGGACGGTGGGTAPLPGTGHRAGEGQDANSSRKVTSISCRCHRSQLGFVASGQTQDCPRWSCPTAGHSCGAASPPPPAPGLCRAGDNVVPGDRSHPRDRRREQSGAGNGLGGETWVGMGLRQLTGTGWGVTGMAGASPGAGATRQCWFASRSCSFTAWPIQS